MDKDYMEQMLIQISSNISEINANLKNFLQRLDNHETRIQQLEKAEDGDFKSEMLKFLSKAFIATLAIIASLTGAGTIFTKVIN